MTGLLLVSGTDSDATAIAPSVLIEPDRNYFFFKPHPPFCFFFSPDFEWTDGRWRWVQFGTASDAGRPIAYSAQLRPWLRD